MLRQTISELKWAPGCQQHIFVFCLNRRVVQAFLIDRIRVIKI